MIRHNTEEIVIRPRLSSAARVALTVGAALVIVGLALGTFRYGVNQGARTQANTRLTVKQLQQDLDIERKRNARLHASLAHAERQLRIDKTAYEELNVSLQASNTELNELSSELRFYRSIIAPTDGRSGVKIQDLAITRARDTDQYRYKLMLIQALQHNEVIKGTVGFVIKGLQDGSDTVIERPTNGEKSIKVKFKYFQNVEGLIDLPSGFEPSEVTVKLVTGTKKRRTTERSYPWPKV